MTSLVEAPRVTEREIPAPPEIPRFWNCPSCPYRIALDFPGGIEEPVIAHASAHTLLELGIEPDHSYGRLHPYLSR